MIKKKKLCVLIIIIIISTLIIVGIALMLRKYEYKSERGITAIEGIVIANDIAHTWSNNATLVGVRIASGMTSDGRFVAWYYKYVNSPNISSESECIEIRVFADKHFNINYNASIGNKKPIINWTVDSDKAYQIAMGNHKIKKFFSKYSPQPDGFFLSAEYGKPVWYIDWCDPGFMDNPKWAKIEINANTGEVINVEADE